MSSSQRPVVKRQYGSRKAARPSQPTSGSSSPLRPSNLSSSSQPSLDWTAAVHEYAVESRSKGKERAVDVDGPDTPPTSSSPPPKSVEKTLRAQEGKLKENENKEAIPIKKGDLRSFFARASPPPKRRSSPSNSESERSSVFMSRQSSNSTSRSSSTSIASTSSRSSQHKKIKLSQLYLDPFDTPGRSTLSCTVCSLSYSRTPEDINFHAKHHKKVTSGIDWTDTVETKAGVTVLQDEIEWDGKPTAKVLMIDWSVADQTIKRKLTDVMDTVDTELSSTSLTPEQLSESKLFVFVTPNRKVVACAVVQRIQQAFQVVEHLAEPDSPEKDDKARLLRFGEDQGAIFCSPTPLPTLLGVHRIWTSTSSRRKGLGTLLLDHVGQRFLYGYPITLDRRQEQVAFSQPTGKGQELATRWTGTKQFRVFVD